MITHIESKVVAGRQVHSCDLCRGRIAKGERHHAASMIGDDGWYTFRSHDYCQAIADEQDTGPWEYPDGYNEYDFEGWMHEAWYEAQAATERGARYPWVMKGWEI